MNRQPTRLLACALVALGAGLGASLGVSLGVSLGAGPAQAQTAEEAARFVFETASLNPGSTTVFNLDGRQMAVQWVAPCEIRITREGIFADTLVGPPGLFGIPGRREEVNPRQFTETAVVHLDHVLLQSGTVTTEVVDGRTISHFQFLADPGAVQTRTVRMAERVDAAGRWIVPDGHEELAWPNLRFSVVETGDKVGRYKAALEYVIGRFCAGKRSAY